MQVFTANKRLLLLNGDTQPQGVLRVLQNNATLYGHMSTPPSIARVRHSAWEEGGNGPFKRPFQIQDERGQYEPKRLLSIVNWWCPLLMTHLRERTAWGLMSAKLVLEVVQHRPMGLLKKNAAS